jgi:hypothetical protein
MDTQIDAQFAAIADDVLAWKLRGAACWHTAGTAAAAAATLLLLPPTPLSPSSSLSSLPTLLASLVATYATTVLVLRAQRNVLAARDVPPVRLPLPGLLAPLLGGGGGGGGKAASSASASTWPALFASRCVLRTRRPADVLAALALYGAYALSGAVGVGLLSGGGGGGAAAWGDPHPHPHPHPSLFPCLYGLVLGLLSAAGHLLGCRNVVSYPSVDLRRWPRLRRRARAAARSALAASAAALPPSLALWGWWAGASASLPLLGGLSLELLLRAWRAALTTSLAWHAGAHALDVVWGEPLQFCGGDAGARAGDDAESRAAAAVAAITSSSSSSSSRAMAAAASAAASCQPTALLAALRHPDPVVQDWAMRDLCLGVAERGGARRRALFADATGATGWRPVTAACLAEVWHACSLLAEDASSGGVFEYGSGVASSPKKGAAAAAAAARRVSAAAGAAGGPSALADLAGWHLRAYTPRLAWAARALAALCAASRTEDTYGLALLPSPDDEWAGATKAASAAASAAASSTPLGEAVVALLALEAGLDAHRRAVAMRGGAAGAIVLADAAADSLADGVRGALYRVCAAFSASPRGDRGEALLSLVARQRPVPAPLRSSAEAARRLRRYLDGEV